MNRKSRHKRLVPQQQVNVSPAPLRRPGVVLAEANPAHDLASARNHALVDLEANRRLFAYEEKVKSAFDNVIPALKKISVIRHDGDFERQAQRIAEAELGFRLPDWILENVWVSKLDMQQLFAWSIFETYHHFANQFYREQPLQAADDHEFEEFVRFCGFHAVDITPCADGRLAHLISYVLRLPDQYVRRKSYAGALFDIEKNTQKWVEVEMLRLRKAQQDPTPESTRYLKGIAYHFSSRDPEHEGCAAHGSDTLKAAQAGLNRLLSFQEAVENSFGRGASIDLLLMGLDTDTDAIRIHLPDAQGDLSLQRFVDCMELYEATQELSFHQAEHHLKNVILEVSPEIGDGMLRFVSYLIFNNFDQIDYVRSYHGHYYSDIGHAERFIGAGVGFKEIQLRNLMYFSYLSTVEEAAQDLDVGIKIFTHLNLSKSLPIPVVVRFDYHGHVPGARDRAVEKCQRVVAAINSRYAELAHTGKLHTLEVVRDCRSNAPLEILNCSIRGGVEVGNYE